MQKPAIVGGMFGSMPPHAAVRGHDPPFLRPDDVTFLNARSALHCLVAQLHPETVWLPSFLCPILTEVAAAQAKVRYYDPVILAQATGDWLGDVGAGDVVLFIDYFGFAYPREWLVQAAGQGACVIEDACQALLTCGVGNHADFVLFSPRKFLGVADGGILSARGDRALRPTEWQPVATEWWSTTLGACTQRADFDLHGGDRGWFELYQQAETTAPTGPFRMSTLSHSAILDQFDYPQISRRRRENYLHLARRLPEYALFPRLDEGVTPLGFPAVFDNRDHVRRHLFAEEIYPPIHWQIRSVVPPARRASHELAGRIATLPCDQRYDIDTMERVVDAVRRVATPCRARGDGYYSAQRQCDVA